MLKNCEMHGFFRGDKCPECDSEGKFLMSEEEIETVGKIMAGVLRHFPEKFDLKMDSYGWVSLPAFVDAVRTRNSRLRWLRPHHIIGIVSTDPKGRYQIENEKLRATYGHTLEVDLDLPTENIPEKLYYPTTEEEVEIILETGIKPVDRKKVHLSKTKEDAKKAGSYRVENPVILEIDAKETIANGFVIKQAGKTVYIVDEVPGKYLSKAES